MTNIKNLSSLDWDVAIIFSQSSRGIRGSMNDEYEAIRNSESNALYQELYSKKKQLGISSLANIASYCNNEDEIKRILYVASKYGRGVANLYMVEFTGRDLKGNLAEG